MFHKLQSSQNAKRKKKNVEKTNENAKSVERTTKKKNLYRKKQTIAM